MSDTFLPAVWFALWGLLWAIYFALDGFDLGAGMLAALLPEDRERPQLIESLAPFWDGNEVWLITAGGVTFAAFPKLYALMFSSLYAPLMLILVALVLRAVAIEFYHLEGNPAWRRFWSRTLAGGSFAVALLFGVAFGNIFRGLPFDQAGYHGTLLSLLNPYGLLTGALFVLAFVFTGSAWMAYRAPGGTLRATGLAYGRRTWPYLFLAAAAFLAYTPFATGLAANYIAAPWLLVLPLAAVAGLVVARTYLVQERAGGALVSAALAVLATVLTGIAGLYPNMFPSSLNTAHNLTAFNAASSPYTLRNMLIVTAVFLPLVLVYQVWFYKVFAAGKSEHEAGY